MKIEYEKTVGNRKLQKQGQFSPIQAIAWSPNNKRLAVCDDDRNIWLYTGDGELLVHFPTKPVEKEFGKNSYVVTAIAFSPDSAKLAVAQSDEAVYVYRLPEDRDKSQLAIIQKYLQISPISSLTWMTRGNLVFGLQDGTILCGVGKKSEVLHQSESHVISVIGSSDGMALISAHMDGSVYSISVENENAFGKPRKLFTSNKPPNCVAFPGDFILLGGSDNSIMIYDKFGKAVQEIAADSSSGDGRRLTAATSSSNGRYVVFAAFNQLRVFSYSTKRGIWIEASPIVIENLYIVPNLAWRTDGTKLAVGSLFGAVDIFDCAVKKRVLRNQYEIIQITADQGFLRNVETDKQIPFQTKTGLFVEKMVVLKELPLAIGTLAGHLLLVGIEDGESSEISWDWIRNSKPTFFLEGHACVIFSDNSLFVVELGQNDILLKATTPNFYSRMFSVKILPNLKLLAFLPNRKTIRVVNLSSKDTVVNFKHDFDVDWMAFNSNCNVVVAKDVRCSLLLCNRITKEKFELCRKAGFVELIQATDILVVQEGNQARIWYNVGEGKEGLTEKSIPIQGKISEIVRSFNQIEIRTQGKGQETQSYILDDPEEQFDVALSRNQLGRAFDFLKNSPESSQKDLHWDCLVVRALDSRDFALAEKIFTTRNDVRAKRELQDMVARITASQKQNNRPMEEVLSHYTTKATIERLKGDFASAEKILLAQGDHKRTIMMYSNAENYIRALKIAEQFESTLVPTLLTKYQNEMSKAGKQFQLAEILAYTGKFSAAAQMLLSQPKLKAIEAYRLIVQNPKVIQNAEGKALMEKALTAFRANGLHELSGKLLELNGDVDGALKAYREAHSYDHAITFARTARPEDVVPLEAEYAKYLVKIRKWQDAITHFVEAHMNSDALEAAINCHDFKKAAQILGAVDDEAVVKEYGQRLAIYFQDRDELTDAVEMYKLINKPKEAVHMFLSRGKIEEAHQYAESVIKTNEILEIFRQEAKLMIASKRYAEAERMLLQIGDVDLAIKMYQDIQQFTKVIALVKKYKEHMLSETYLSVAEAYRKMGSLRQAELYFVKGGRNKEMVQMYVEEEKWPDAYRCAQDYFKEMADDILHLWINQLPLKEGLTILRNLGAAKQYVRVALKAKEFDKAITVAKEMAPDILPEVYLQTAAALAESGRHLEAERDFLAANRPDEAIQMYIDAGKWQEAIRLTTAHYPEELPKVLMGHASVLADSGNYTEAESHFISLNKPDYAINMYKANGKWEDAIRIAREYRPSEIQTLELEYNRANTARPGTSRPGENLLKQAREREEHSDYSGAVQIYLRYLSDPSSTDPKQLLRVCGRVRELAASFLGDADARIAIDTVANKYIAVNQPRLAAAAFLEANQNGQALQVLMDTGEWDEARLVVQKLGDPQYTQVLETSYKEFLRKQGRVEQLASVDAASALEIYARNSEWEKCLKICMELRDIKLLSKYLHQYGVILLQSGEEQKAMQLFLNHGVPVGDDNVDIYRHIFTSFITKSFSNIDEGYRIWTSLRDLMFAVCENLLRKTAELSVGLTAEFEKYLQIAIYYANHFALISEEATKELGWRVLLSLLRYSDIVNPDKAFYDAGRAARELGWTGTADALMNFYLDWRECILHQNIGLVDYNDFVGSDIPTKVTIPSDSSVSDEAYEEVKNWIMKAAVEGNLKYDLRKDDRGVFEISLSGGRYPPCVLTGYPVLNNGVKLGTSGKYARKPDLNCFLQAVRSTRSDKLDEIRRFFMKWCGATTDLNYAFV